MTGLSQNRLREAAVIGQPDAARISTGRRTAGEGAIVTTSLPEESVRRLVAAAKTAYAYSWAGADHPDACASNPPSVSGADALGPCDCFVGELKSALDVVDAQLTLANIAAIRRGE